MRQAIRLALARDGHEVVEAPDGPAGIFMARKENPHLILLDLMMPFMSGQEVARYLRYDEQLSAIPIIVITAVNQVDSVLDLLAMKNVRDYFLKPIDTQALRQRVRSVLEDAPPTPAEKQPPEPQIRHQAEHQLAHQAEQQPGHQSEQQLDQSPGRNGADAKGS